MAAALVVLAVVHALGGAGLLAVVEVAWPAAGAGADFKVAGLMAGWFTIIQILKAAAARAAQDGSGGRDRERQQAIDAEVEDDEEAEEEGE